MNDIFKDYISAMSNLLLFRQLRALYGNGVRLETFNEAFNRMYPAPAIVSVKVSNNFEIRLADPDDYNLWQEILEERIGKLSLAK